MQQLKAILKPWLRPYVRNWRARQARHNNRKKLSMSDAHFRWGILSTGGIAHKFADAIANLPDAVVTAVGSRRQASADAFGERFAIPNRHSSYEALAADPDVDAIYIATPHNLHMENTLLCLDHGKHVLCEKPFAVNAKQAQTMADRAREKGLFLMEAMWTRFLPAATKVRQLLAEGRIGTPRLFVADFGFAPPFDPQGRLFNIELAGGALLDLGIYPVSYAAMVLGTSPDKIMSAAHLGETGVDEVFSAVLVYDGGQQQALLAGSLRTVTERHAFIYGSQGTIHIHPNFFHSEKVDVIEEQRVVESYDLPLGGNGFEAQAKEVADNVRAGKTESAILPLDESIAIMKLLDEIRTPWGLLYPGE